MTQILIDTRASSDTDMFDALRAIVAVLEGRAGPATNIELSFDDVNNKINQLDIDYMNEQAAVGEAMKRRYMRTEGYHA